MTAAETTQNDSQFHLTVPELAARMRLNKFTVYHLLKQAPHKLPPVTRLETGGIRFRESDVQRWFDNLRAKAIATTSEPPRRRRGRPTKVEQLQRLYAGGAQ